MATERKHWQVRGSMQDPGKNWRSNLEVHVVTTSARRALELFEAAHPTATVHVVQQCGRIDYVDDTAGAAQ